MTATCWLALKNAVSYIHPISDIERAIDLLKQIGWYIFKAVS